MTQNPTSPRSAPRAYPSGSTTLSRQRLQYRQPAGARRHQERRRRHHQPDDLPEGTGRGRRLRRADRRARRARRRRGRGHPHGDHRRCPQRLRRVAPQCTRLRRRRRPGVDRGRPAAGARRRQDHRRRPSSCGGSSTGPTCSSRSRPPRRACPPSPRRWPKGSRVNVTLIFSVERYRAVMDAYLEGLEAGQGGRPRPVQDPLGGVVLRLPGGHRDRQAAGEDRLRRGAGAARARPAWPTPGWPTRPTRRCSSAATLGTARGRRGAAAAAAVGVDRRQEPGLLRHALRHRAGRPEHGQHHAGDDDCTRSPTTVWSPATPSRGTAVGRARSLRQARRRSAST